MKSFQIEIECYTPQIIEGGYALMLIQVAACPICKKIMVYIPKDSYALFPAYCKIQAKAQIERAGWIYMSTIKQDDKNICVECVKAGKVTFFCSICEERKPTSKIQESIGWPPEYMCTDCYETKSAKEWQKHYNALEKDHRYDYE